MSSRVFLTGIGVISPIGIGRERFWSAMLAAKDGSSAYDPLVKENFPSRKAGIVRDFDPKSLLDGYNYLRMPRYDSFAIAAIELAIQDSRIQLDLVSPNRKGLIFSTIRGSFETTVLVLTKLLTAGPAAVSPLKFAHTVTNSPATPVSIRHQLKGPSTVLQGVSAVSTAYDYLRNGHADVIIAGGVDVITSVDPFRVLLENHMLAHAEDQVDESSRPADVRRNGIVYGEAAGFVVLETEKGARERNADVYCELLGYSTTHDNKAIKLFNQRNAEPMVRAMMDALKDARVQPDEIDYINCMANSCPGVDEVEAESIRCVFNKEREIPIGTFKGSTGEVFGASDCLGVIQTALTLKERTIAPIANLEAIDPQCALHYVRHSPQDRNVKTALTHSFEVGGNVQAKVVRSFEGFKA